MLDTSFNGGEDPKELAAKFWEENKAHKAELLQQQPGQISELVKTLGPSLGYPKLGGTDAFDFALEFTTEVRRLALASEV
jgi:hypothetical protein